MNERTIPPAVRSLAEQVKLTPLDWWEHPDHITITFVEGPKMTFTREQVTPAIQKISSAPSAPSTEPLISAPPVQSSQKKRKKE